MDKTIRESWLNIATFLGHIAEALAEHADRAGHAAPRWVQLTVQPNAANDGDEAAQIEELAGILPVETPHVKKMSNGSWHYRAFGGEDDPVQVKVYTSVSQEWAAASGALSSDDLRAEIEKHEAAARALREKLAARQVTS